MGQLFNILGTQKEEISLALVENLERAECGKFLQTQAGSFTSLANTMDACRSEPQGGDPQSSVPRQWAAPLHEEAATLGISSAEVLTGLNCLQQAVRFHVIKAENRKPVLLNALDELGSVVDRMRQCYLEQCCLKTGGDLETRAATTSGSEDEPHDFTGFVESADFFICLATLHGKPFYLNPAGRKLLGLAAREPLPTASLHGFYGKESWAQLRDVAVPAVRATGQWEGRSRVRNQQTGETCDVLTSMFLAKHSQSDKPSSLAILHRSADEQLRVEEALAESQARKHSILESSLDPIITIDHEGVITEFNRAAEHTFGHSRQKVLGTQPSEVLFPPAKSAGHRHRIDRYLDAGEGSLLGRRIEVEAVRADGEMFPAELAMTISQEQGCPVLSFFVRDISKRKKAEEARARYEAELERSNRELEQFAYVASHDLQEPLRKIRTFSDRLEMKSGDLLNETGRECIQRMQSAAARMQLLIEGLLTLSRVTTRDIELNPVELSEIASEVVSDLEVKIEQVGGHVEIGKLPRIQADPVQMRQLLQNLVGNALKFH
ncbi:MAG: PAS domain S-box protein, partial [Thermoguttaceae bacterium]